MLTDTESIAASVQCSKAAYLSGPWLRAKQHPRPCSSMRRVIKRGPYASYPSISKSITRFIRIKRGPYALYALSLALYVLSLSLGPYALSLDWVP